MKKFLVYLNVAVVVTLIDVLFNKTGLDSTTGVVINVILGTLVVTVVAKAILGQMKAEV